MKWSGAQWVAVVGFAVLAAVVVYAVFNSHPQRRGDTAINASERAAELAKAGKRGQVITFTSAMTPIDQGEKSGASLYVIGVSQFTLGEAEQIEAERHASGGGSYRGFNHGASLYSDGSSFVNTKFGPFNNLLIFEKLAGTSEKIFDTRISISRFTVCSGTEPHVLAIFAASVDSNGDGLVDDADLQDLYIYNLADHSLHKIEALNASAEDVVDLPGVNYLVIQGAVDRNKDGKITSQTDGNEELEPRMLYKVDLRTFEATPLLPAALTKALQATLDGIAPAPVQNK